MEKVKEFIYLFLIVLAFITFLAIIGTAGASDLDNISPEQVKAQLIPALVLFVLACIGANKLGGGNE